MLEKLHGIPQRIAALKAKLKAREGRAEYKENVPALKAEIARLEALSLNRDALEQFVSESAEPALASGENPGAASSADDVTL